MSDKVFVLNASKVLTPMTRVGFESEDVFQVLLAEHPELLGSTEAGVPLLVSREQGIADSADGGNRWSVDHLYLDARGVPILVEVKRATDTRARREVVAQMLDYAAHAVTHSRFRHGREEMASKQLRLWGYDFEYMPISLISAVYDRFLKEEADKKNAEGAFYTPTFLADMVVNQIWDELSDEQRDRGIFCDPACGSGGPSSHD